jgi:general secretion pathway protein C
MNIAFIVKTVTHLLGICFLTAAIYFGVDMFYKKAVTPLEYVPSLPAAPKAKPQSPEGGPRPLSHYQPIFTRNLFDLPQEKIDLPKPVEIKKLKETSLNLKLYGTVTCKGGQPCAVILDPKEKKQKLYLQGDFIGQAQVKEIFREKVVLNIDGRDEILNMEKARSTHQRPGPAALSRRKTLATRPPTSIKVKKSNIRKSVANLNSLLREIQARPYFLDGKQAGISINKIKPDSVFQQLGLRNGDVITGVEGQDIRSMRDGLNLLNQLDTSASVRLNIQRRGVPETIEYKVE